MRLDATREEDDRASTALTRARYHSPARLVRDRRVDCETLTFFYGGVEYYNTGMARFTFYATWISAYPSTAVKKIGDIGDIYRSSPSIRHPTQPEEGRGEREERERANA